MKTLTLILILLLTVGLASASTVQFVTFNNGGSYTNGSVSVGPYSLTLGNSPSDSLAQNIFAPCLSDLKTVTNGQTWWATEINILNFSNSTQTYLKEMAWLDMQFASINTNATVAPVQQAIWDLGNQISGVSKKYNDTATNAWLTQAASNYSSVSNTVYSQYSVLIPNSPNSATGSPLNILNIGNDCPSTPQYFLVQSSVPEPAGFILMGSGLIILAAFAKKFNKRT